MTETRFTQAVRTLVAKLNREAASGLISRKALIALDLVQRLLEVEAAAMHRQIAKPAESHGASA